MAATKNNTRIHTRSPFYINAVPSTGTITQADLTITLQTGTRLATGSMTDLKTYNLSSTNVIDNVIVFNISPLIQDYVTRTTEIFDASIATAATANECLYVSWDLTITRTGGTDNSSGYYVGVEGYSKYDDGVNWQPVTDATGNYGDPTWSPIAAKETDRTIMATQCYRQIGEESYAVLPVYMGEFDNSNTDAETFVRLAFGGYTNAFTYSSSSDPKTDYTIQDSDTRSTNHLNNIQYIPIGKKNVEIVDGNWKAGYDYITAGHVINRKETSAGKATTTVTLGSTRGTSVFTGAQIEIDMNTELEAFDLDVGDTITLNLPAFTGVSPCTDSYSASTVTTTYSSTVGATTISVDVTGGASVEARVDCFFTSLGEVLNFDVIIPVLGVNDIAIVNDNPLMRYEIICEPKHRVVDLFFVNRWGAWDCFSFLKTSREKISANSETYYKSIGSIESNAYTYDKYNNQIQRHNIQMKKTFTVNTGYVAESFNQLLEEMLATPRAFMIWDGIRVPVNVNDTRQELKEHVNEKLINYTLELEASNDYINNVV